MSNTTLWVIGGVAVLGLGAFAIYSATKNQAPIPPSANPVDNTGKDILGAINTFGGLVDTLFSVFGGSDKTSDRNAGHDLGEGDEYPDTSNPPLN